MNTVFTIDVRGNDSVKGFNDKGDVYAAARTANGTYFCGRNNAVNHYDYEFLAASRKDAIAWIVSKLLI